MKLLVSLGHAEYEPRHPPELTRRLLWDPLAIPVPSWWDADDAEALARKAFLHAHPDHADGLPDWDLTWESVEEWEGDPADFEMALSSLLAQLREGPSGDDDTFDYWPSGVRLARQVAAALDRERSIRPTRDAGVVRAAHDVLARIGVGIDQFAYLDLEEARP